jgi:hypothetical protein
MIATTLSMEAGEVAQWVWRTSLEASLLIAVVFLIGWAAGRKLPPRWRYVLGLLILARLVLPITLPGTWGFSRLVPDDISEPRWTQGYDTMEQSEQEVVPAPVIVKSPSVGASPRRSTDKARCFLVPHRIVGRGCIAGLWSHGGADDPVHDSSPWRGAGGARR